MNAIPNAWFLLPVDFEAMQSANPNPMPPVEPGREDIPGDRPPCPDQRQARTGSVTHYDRACHTRRFEAWLHGSQVLDAPLTARYLDRPEHQAEALERQRRAVREGSYVPAGMPLLLL